MQINFFINNNLVQPPENIKELVIELNYDKENIERQIGTNKWHWVRENATTINDYIADGLISGAGVFEGFPLRIEIEHFGITEILSDGYIDLTEETDIGCNEITVTGKEKQGVDWLNDVADSVSFERIYAENPAFKSADFVFVPYIINTVPNYLEAFVSIVTGVMVGVQLQSEIRLLIANITDSAGYLTTIPGVIKLVAQILYIVILITILVGLIIAMILYIIQPVKYHAGTFLKRLFERGCGHFGLTFQSTIFNFPQYEKFFIIPNKYQLSDTGDTTGVFSSLGGSVISAGIKGFTSPNINLQEGFFKGTFGDFLRLMKTIFNAKVVIKNGVLIFERRDFNTSTTLYQLPDLRNDFHQLNTSEIKSNYLIEFQTDLNDKNTIDKFTGSNFQVTLQPVIVNDPKLKLMKNFERVSISLALGKRKEVLTVPEKIVNTIIDIINIPLYVMGVIVNGAISAINSIIEVVNDIFDALNALPGITLNVSIPLIPGFNPPSINNPISDRIGMLLLENDYIDVPKIVMLNQAPNERDTKLALDNETFLTAKKLWDEWHYINSFAEVNGKHNQWKKYEFKGVPFCFDEYLLVKNDNKILTPDGIDAELISLKWNVYEQVADIRFRVNEKYTNNLQIKYLEPDGN